MKKRIALLLLVVMCISSLIISCAPTETPSTQNTEKTSTTPTTPTPTEEVFVPREIPADCLADGATDVIIVPENLYAFYNSEYHSYFGKGNSVNTQAKCDAVEYGYADGTADVWYPLSVKLGWEDTEDQKYVVLLSEDDKFTNPLSYNTDVNYVSITNLKVGTKYYWKATNLSGADVSKVCTFTTAANQVRTLNIEGIKNTRDLGGYVTLDGKIVKQGMLIRTGELDDVTEKGLKTLVDELGIKTELDLRGSSEGSIVESVVDAGITYTVINGIPYTKIFEFETYARDIEQTRKAFEILGNADNYPILFHCAIGTDRTGTIGLLIQALLGMSDEDMIKNYEYSWFFDLNENEQELGGARVKESFLPLMSALKRGQFENGPAFGDKNNTIAQNTELYLKYIGVTQEQIDTIKSVMLQDAE